MTRPPLSGKVHVRPVRSLPPVPAIAEIEKAMKPLLALAAGIPTLYREALEIAYPVGGAFNGGTRSGDADPTLAAVMAGLVNDEEDDRDWWSPERQAIRSAVDAIAEGLRHLDIGRGRLSGLIRVHQRSGMAVDQPEEGPRKPGASSTYTTKRADDEAKEWAREHPYERTRAWRAEETG